ncbi:MAG: PAS domain S-box protein [Desulfococcaceae bacterium]
MPPIDPGILEQIILLQSTLHVMQDDRGMAKFLCRGLSRLPSLASVSIYIGEKLISEEAPAPFAKEDCRRLFRILSDGRFTADEQNAFESQFRDQFQARWLRIETALKLYGVLLIEHPEPCFDNLAPYIENTLNIMALVIENNRQKTELMNHQAVLENLVLKRTRALQKNVHRLEVEVAERRRAEDRLSEALAWHETLFNGSRDAVFISDASARFIEVNDAACRLTGYDRPELLTMRIPDLHEEIDLDAFRKFHGRIMAGEAIVSEAPILRKDGQKIDTEFNNQRVVIGDTAYMHTAARDISKRKQAEKALRESTERFQKVFNSQLDAIFVLDAETPARIIDCNTAVTRIFGYEPQELIGRTVRRLFVDENRLDAFQKKLYQRMKSEGVLKDMPFTMKRKDGAAFPSEHTVLELTNEIGERTGWISVIRDLTDRKQMEDRLRQAQKMEAIGALAGGIAHDFNNLLFPILGISEMLLEDLPPGDPNHDSAGEIYKAARRAGELTNQILSFSRQTDHKKSPIEVQAILKEVLKLSRATIPAYIDILQDIQKDCGPVLADPTQVHQIAMNLITNAYHAVEPEGGRISVRLREIGESPAEMTDTPLRPGRYVRLTVSDTGCGIEPAVMEKIFEPYFTTKKKGKGTGLGLSVVYGIVKEHGGEIRVSSELGQGTAFDVYLPVVKPPSRTATADAAEPFPTGTERVMMVDDEAPIVRLVTQMLERLGYQVTGKTDSIDALEAFKADPDGYDLVITDVSMPHLPGDRLSRELIAVRPDLPIIICTGFSEKIDPKIARSLGIRGFLMKPIVKSDLARLVRKVLDEKQEG